MKFHTFLLVLVPLALVFSIIEIIYDNPEVYGTNHDYQDYTFN